MEKDLEDLIAAAKLHVMSPKEQYEQMLSFVYGSLKLNDPRTLDDVRRALAAQGIVDPSPHIPTND